MNAKNFSDRLDFAISKVGNIGDMVKAANISYTTISRWKEGSDPKMSNLIALADIANVNLDWLMTGRGTPDGGVSITDEQTNSKHTNQDEYCHVLYYRNIAASAGGGSFSDGVVETGDYLAFRKDWVNANGFKVKDLVALTTSGDSMLPTIPENATILIDKSKNSPRDGRIYVVRIDDRLYVKRIQWIPTGGLRLISDNHVYESFDITRQQLEQGDIQVYGQVVHIAYDLPH